MRNFLDCVKSRALPTCDIEIAQRSTNTCHLGNISYKLGRKLEWDAENETFKNDPEANALLDARAAQGYELPRFDGPMAFEIREGREPHEKNHRASHSHQWPGDRNARYLGRLQCDWRQRSGSASDFPAAP